MWQALPEYLYPIVSNVVACVYIHLTMWHHTTPIDTQWTRLTTQIQHCEDSQMWQTIAQCICSIVSDIVGCTRTYIQVNLHGITQHHHTKEHTLTRQVQECEASQACQAPTQCFCSTISDLVACTCTYANWASRAIPPSSTLTTQI